jgi:integrase
MPTKERTFMESVRQYADRKIKTTPRYRREIVRTLTRAGERLARAGMELGVRRMGDREVLFVYETAGGGLTNRRYEAEMLRSFLRASGNVTSPLSAPLSVPERPRVTPEAFDSIYEAALRAGDLRGACILLLESLSIRRIGVSRMRPEDLSPSSVTVLDKGRMGGKPRRIPITPEVWEQLQQYLEWRQGEIMRVLAANPTHPIPRRLIVWAKATTMGDARLSALDLYVKACGRRAGVNLSHHMLRRMACRELWENTDKPEVAMEISGHKDLEVFLSYVGSMESQKAALVAKVMESREKRQKQLLPVR